jgi:hypothetical protein
MALYPQPVFDAGRALQRARVSVVSDPHRPAHALVGDLAAGINVCLGRDDIPMRTIRSDETTCPRSRSSPPICCG